MKRADAQGSSPAALAAFGRELLARKGRGVLAHLVSVAGSHYRRPGARMILAEDGSRAGSISGGCIEAELDRRAPEVLAAQEPLLVEYDLSGSDDIVFGFGLGCGGRIGVRLTVLDAAELAEIERAAEDARVNLLLAGAGEDLLPLAPIAEILGWRFDVVAPRVTPKAQRRWAPVLERPIRSQDEIESVVTSSTAVLVATHNYLDDLEILRALIPTAAPYIGLLGSRDRVARLIEDASDVGSRMASSRLYGPAGLDVGAETPEEIALSIAAEIQAFRRGRCGGFLRDRAAAIHERSPSQNAFSSIRMSHS